MAVENDNAAGGTAPTEEAGGDLRILDWSCRLMGVERIEADPPDDDAAEDIFSVTFQVDGPNANAEVEILVTDHDEEVEVIAVALDTLHRAMKAWGRLTENRRIAARDPVA